MMDVTNEQIEEIFRRQVRLCRGIGYRRMIEIVKEAYSREPVQPPSRLRNIKP